MVGAGGFWGRRGEESGCVVVLQMQQVTLPVGAGKDYREELCTVIDAGRRLFGVHVVINGINYEGMLSMVVCGAAAGFQWGII